jgi:DNA-binding FadR family transcriptional regulator
MVPDHRAGAHRKAAVWLARDLANYIANEQLAEGTKLPPEHEMIASYGVGRSTLREAMRILEMHGVVMIRPGRGGGPVVRHPKSTDLSESLQLILQFQGTPLSAVIDSRILLEPPLTGQAALVATDADLANLQSTVDGIRENPKDLQRFSFENARFHSLIPEIMQQPVVGVFLDALKYVHDAPSQGLSYSPKRVKAVTDDHERVIAALSSGNQEAAEQAMRTHLVDAKNYWAKYFTASYRRTVHWLDD